MPYPATFSGPQTRADWAAQNPYVPQFEFAQESDAPYGIKAGPGYWNDLPYINQTGIKVYRATLTQSLGDAPVATVLENTLGGTVVWTRTSAGNYAATLAGAFPVQVKVFSQAAYGTSTGDAATDGIILTTDWSGTDAVVLVAYAIDGAPADMKVNNATVQILVYP